MVGDAPPAVVVLAGPNGAGKSTTARRLLRGELAVSEFVNADAIARGLSEFNPEGVAFEAGTLLLERLDALAEARRSFAFETTMASRSFAPRIRRLTGLGYQFHLVYRWLPTAELAIARVAARVRAGGHFVPDDVVRHRRLAGLRNFFRLYQPLALTWRMYDNTDPTASPLVAAGTRATTGVVRDEALWASIRAEADQ